MASDAPIGSMALLLAITSITLIYLHPYGGKNFADTSPTNCTLLDGVSLKHVMATNDCTEYLYQLLSDPTWCFESIYSGVFVSSIGGNISALTYSRFIAAGEEKECRDR